MTRQEEVHKAMKGNKIFKATNPRTLIWIQYCHHADWDYNKNKQMDRFWKEIGFMWFGREVTFRVSKIRIEYP